MIAWKAFLEYFVFAGEKAKLGAVLLLVPALVLRKTEFLGKAYGWFSKVSTSTLLTVILVTAFSLRLGWILWSPHSAPSAITEDAAMLRLAGDLADGKGYLSATGEFTSERPVAYPLMLSILFRLFGKRIWMIELMQAIFGTFGVYLLFYLGNQIFNRGVGLLSATLLAFYPTSIFSTKVVLEEHVFIILWLAGISFLISDFQKPGWIKVLAAGLILGISAHFRTYAFAMGLVVLALWVLIKKKFWPGILRAIGIQILILIWAIPWAVRNYHRLGEPVLYSTTTGMALYWANNETSDVRYPVNPSLEQGGDPDFLSAANEVERDKAGRKAAWKWIRRHPRVFAEKAIGRAIYMLGIDREGWVVTDNFHTIQFGRSRPSDRLIRRFEKMDNDYYGHIFLLALVGAILFFLKRDTAVKQKSLWCILLTLVYYLSIISLTLGHRKYRFVIEPFFCLLAAYGLFVTWFGFAAKPKETASDSKSL